MAGDVTMAKRNGEKRKIKPPVVDGKWAEPTERVRTAKVLLRPDERGRRILLETARRCNALKDAVSEHVVRRCVLDDDAIHQDIWTFPVGVAFSKTFETESGWTVKPSLDLSVIPAAGNLSAKSAVRFAGTGLFEDIDARTMDPVAYQGKAGLDFGKGPVRLGLNYALQASEHTTAHGVFATIRFEC
jgi:hypothetical protein